MELIEKLEKWAREHPKEADLPAMNITTGKVYTIREVLEAIKKEKEMRVPIVDKDLLEVKGNIEKWLEEV